MRNVLSAIPSDGKVFLAKFDTVGLEKALLSQPELRIFDDKMQFLGSGWASVKIRDLALWLIRRALDVGPDAAVANLSKYVSDAKIPFRQTMVLAGVRVRSPIKLGKGVEVVPFESPGAPYFKEDLTENYNKFPANGRPSATLRQIVLYPRDHRDRKAESDSLWLPTDPWQDLEDVRLCITALGPSGPATLGAWTEPAEWVPASFASGAISRAFVVGGYPKETVEDISELPEIHSRWVALKEEERQHLRVSLSRINTALRREHIIDSTIDLGIAIESLFLPEREADRGELQFTQWLGAARYLGHDETARQDIVKTFSALYRMKSEAVHTGILPGNINGFNTHVMLNRGYNLAGKAIRRIILEGEPDWQKVMYS
jgi:hypothetical protein